MANNGKGIGPNSLGAPKSAAKYSSMAKQTTKDSKSGKQLKTNNTFSDYNAGDLKITDPIKKHFDGYSAHSRTLTGRSGTNTTASGETLFPGYSSKSIGTYKKGGKTFNKIRPGLEARSFGEYEKMNQAQNKRKINQGVDPIDAQSFRSGVSRQPGTFKQYINTGTETELNLASKPTPYSTNYKRSKYIEKRQGRMNEKQYQKLYSK